MQRLVVVVKSKRTVHGYSVHNLPWLFRSPWRRTCVATEGGGVEIERRMNEWLEEWMDDRPGRTRTYNLHQSRNENNFLACRAHYEDQPDIHKTWAFPRPVCGWMNENETKLANGGRGRWQANTAARNREPAYQPNWHGFYVNHTRVNRDRGLRKSTTTILVESRRGCCRASEKGSSNKWSADSDTHEPSRRDALIAILDRLIRNQSVGCQLTWSDRHRAEEWRTRTGKSRVLYSIHRHSEELLSKEANVSEEEDMAKKYSSQKMGQKVFITTTMRHTPML